MYIYIHLMYVCTYVCMYINMYIYNVYIITCNTHIYIYTYIYMYIYIYVYIYICIYTCTTIDSYHMYEQLRIDITWVWNPVSPSLLLLIFRRKEFDLPCGSVDRPWILVASGRSRRAKGKEHGGVSMNNWGSDMILRGFYMTEPANMVIRPFKIVTLLDENWES